MAIRPNYYKDEAGHDLFWKMEHGMYDLAWSIGFCHINAEKYERRMGRKTAIGIEDERKAQTYRAADYFASRKNEELQQTFTKDELEQISEAYKQYATKVEA